MSIAALTNDNWAQICSFLPVKDRVRCALTCKRFKEILYSGRYDTVLWPKSSMQKLGSQDYKCAFVTRALQRTLFGFEGATFTPVALSAQHTGPVGQFLCFGKLIISCVTRQGEAAIGEVKIHNTEISPVTCTATIPRISIPHAAPVETAFTRLQNWLVRSSVLASLHGFMIRCEVFEIDKTNGQVKEIFSQEVATIADGRGVLLPLIAPQRLGNKLYIATPSSSTIQVWNLETQPMVAETIPALNYDLTVTHMKLEHEALVVGYSDGHIKIIRGQNLSIPMDRGHILFDRFSALPIPGMDMIQIRDLSKEEPTLYRLDVPIDSMTMPNFGFDHDWILYHGNKLGLQLQQLPPEGFYLFNIKDNKGKLIKEHAYFPASQGLQSILLGWHHFVQLANNKLEVFSLYDLKKKDDVIIPNTTYTLPEGRQVSAAWFHKGILLAGDDKGHVWRFMLQSVKS